MEDRRTESQFKSPYEPNSERDIRYRFMQGDETAVPTNSQGKKITQESHPELFGSLKRKRD